MGVDSYAEIFTLTLGWHFYNVIWDVLAATGIVYLPFLGILIEHWKDAYVAGDEGNGAAVAVRALEIDIGLALTVLMLACVPTNLTALNRAAVFYAPPATTAEPSPTTATGAAPRSTFGASLNGTPASVNLPVWWYSVLALSSGINHAIIAGAGIRLDDIRKVAEQAKHATIANPHVRHEARRFYNECFVPARSRYFGAPTSAAAAAAIAVYGPDDPDWMGSHAYRDDPRLYAVMYSETEVPGWAFDPARDREFAGAAVVPEWGRPTCKQWWEDAAIGLRRKLLDQAQATSKLLPLVDTFGAGLTEERRADLVVQTLIDKTRLLVTAQQYAPVNGSLLGDAAKSGITTIGATVTGFFTWLSLAVIKPSLPFVQAIILMGICLFLAPIMVIARYSLSAMVLGAIAIFTVKFWSVMWFITDFLDDRLILAMYPDADSALSALGSLFTHGDYAKAMLLNLVVVSLYMGLPVLWTGLMAMIGVQVGSAIRNAQIETMRGVHSAAATSGTVAKYIGGGLKGGVARGARGIGSGIRSRRK